VLSEILTLIFVKTVSFFQGCLLFVCLFVIGVHLFIYLFVCLFVCLSVCLFACLIACLIVCLFVCWFVCLLKKTSFNFVSSLPQRKIPGFLAIISPSFS